MKYLGIDYGTVRIGTAISDALGIIANPLKTIPNNEKAIAVINDIINQEKIAAIVMGLPKHMNNDEGEKAMQVREFASLLPPHIKVYYQDERLTTRQAQTVLINANVKRQERKKVIDQMAATIILQTFLDSNSKL